MKAKTLTEGAISLAIYTIMLLIFLYVPIFGAIIIFALPVSYIYFTAKHNWKDGLLVFIASVILTFIIGSWAALFIPFSYGIVGIVLGWCIYTKKERFISFSAASLVLLISLVIGYIVTTIFFNIDYLKEIQDMVSQSLNESMTMLEMLGQETEQMKTRLNEFGDLFITLLPSLLILLSAISVLLIQLISYPILKRLGVEVSHARPFRDISLPKSLIWYFLIIMILSLVIEAEKGTFIYNVITNFLFVIDFLFVLQAITFLFNVCYKKGIHKTWAIVGTIFILLNPLANQLAKIIGIFDLGFDLRNQIQRKE
ncbi:YybS family protein [Bacillus andreraoultii]|uniref:YybS family protein n=1 Tax=Bacillus andreraoultii TaxID=1499685 RepID=UPI00053A972E|nr:YybS family protein [Bacillus andreraoultii]